MFPRPGLPRASPPGLTTKVKNVFCFKLDAMGVPVALATTILILLMFSIVLAHQWGPRNMGPPHPLVTPHRHPWAPLVTPGAHGRAGGVHVPNSAKKTIIRLLASILPGGAECIRDGGKEGPSLPPDAGFFSKKRQHISTFPRSDTTHVPDWIFVS